METTHAILLCEGRCSDGHPYPQPKPHSFSRVVPHFNGVGALIHMNDMFTCDRCGTQRKWGCEDAAA